MCIRDRQRDGEDGRKKIAEYTRYVTVALALIESIAMAVGFGGQGLLSAVSYTHLDYTIKLNKKERKLALKSALTSRVNENKFIVVDELSLIHI